MKALIILIVSLFSQMTYANHWKHINEDIQGYKIRFSYTIAYSPATYGSQGGRHEGLFYVDVHSRYPARAEGVEIYEIERSRKLIPVSAIPFKENNSRHFYGQKPGAKTYAERIWAGKEYLFKIYIDGKILEGKFRI